MLQENQSFMAAADIETIYNNNICQAISYKLLLSLFCKGNNNAYDIMIGKNNGQITIEDLSQELLLFLTENSDKWYLYRTMCRYSTDKQQTKIIFFDEKTKKDFFRIVSNTLYKEKTRHESRKLWIEMDGDEINIDDISALASHTCINDVITLSLYQEFLQYLKNTKPKKAELFINFINTRLQGYKIRECATILNIKDSAAFDCAKQLKVLWKQFNK